jgi:hypothetical protein
MSLKSNQVNTEQQIERDINRAAIAWVSEQRCRSSADRS